MYKIKETADYLPLSQLFKNSGLEVSGRIYGRIQTCKGKQLVWIGETVNCMMSVISASILVN